MKKQFLAILLAGTLTSSLLAGCGSSNEQTEQQAEQVEEKVEEASSEATETVSETVEAASEESSDVLEELEAIGDVDVDKNLFDVTITIPKDFIGDTTQEELDKSVAEKGYQSAILNDDGNVTYVMTKAQHKELVDTVAKQIDNATAEMIGSEQYPNITGIQANSDYTKFTVTTKSSELSLAESFSVMAFYTFGGMYGVFSGEKADNIQVEFVNADTGKVMNTANSKDLGDGN